MDQSDWVQIDGDTVTMPLKRFKRLLNWNHRLSERAARYEAQAKSLNLILNMEHGGPGGWDSPTMLQKRIANQRKEIAQLWSENRRLREYILELKEQMEED